MNRAWNPFVLDRDGSVRPARRALARLDAFEAGTAAIIIGTRLGLFDSRLRTAQIDGVVAEVARRLHLTFELRVPATQLERLDRWLRRDEAATANAIRRNRLDPARTTWPPSNLRFARSDAPVKGGDD